MIHLQAETSTRHESRGRIMHSEVGHAHADLKFFLNTTDSRSEFTCIDPTLVVSFITSCVESATAK